MSIEQEMRERLTAALEPTVLTITDESEAHRGHAGYQDGGESHWRVVIGAPSLDGETRLARHRAVHAAIGSDVIGRIHALAIEFV